jgi:bacterioferritin
MQGDPRIIDLLNQVLRKELTGINQYFIHSRMCKNWGYAVLEKVAYDEAIEEMKHADLVIQRILFLEGVPNLADYDRILVGATPRDQFRERSGAGARRAVGAPSRRRAVPRDRRPRDARPSREDRRR